MEYIISAVSAIIYDQLIKQETYPARVDNPNTHVGA